MTSSFSLTCSLSAVAAAARQLFGTTQGRPGPAPLVPAAPDPCHAGHDHLLLAVFVLLSVRLYTRRTR